MSYLICVLFSNGCFTTGNLLYAVCQKVCREPQHGHSAKNLFAECLEPNTRQTRGTRHNPYLPSAGARQTNGTRQNMDMPSASERAHGKAGARASHARRPSRPFALPSASRLALGKMRFCRVSFPGTRQSPVLPKKKIVADGGIEPATSRIPKTHPYHRAVVCLVSR